MLFIFLTTTRMDMTTSYITMLKRRRDLIELRRLAVLINMRNKLEQRRAANNHQHQTGTVTEPQTTPKTGRPSAMTYSVFDLVHRDGYVPFYAREVKGTLVPCTAKSFGSIREWRWRSEDTTGHKGYQTFNTEWGLGRVRTREGEPSIQTLRRAIDQGQLQVWTENCLNAVLKIWNQ